jgi:hypothetical protein
MNYKYEVSLSFTGEDRKFAEAVAKGLKENGIEVFYDDFYAADLWGADLSLKLRDVYYAESRYCIMILSENYLEKMWASFERQQAIERLIQEKGNDYILPVRLDGFNKDVPGLSNIIGYLSVRSSAPDKVVNSFLKKMGKFPVAEKNISENKSKKHYIPKIKKTFSDKDKNTFLKEAYEVIISLIDQFAKETHEQHPEFEHDFEKVTSRKAIYALYRDGKELIRFKIWLGGIISNDSINYSSGRNIDNDNSFNEALSLAEHESELKLKPLGMRIFSSEKKEYMSPQEAAEYLWEMACDMFS